VILLVDPRQPGNSLPCDIECGTKGCNACERCADTVEPCGFPQVGGQLFIHVISSTTVHLGREHPAKRRCATTPGGKQINVIYVGHIFLLSDRFHVHIFMPFFTGCIELSPGLLYGVDQEIKPTSHVRRYLVVCSLDFAPQIDLLLTQILMPVCEALNLITSFVVRHYFPWSTVIGWPAG
jgi:hypothetical protein